MFQEIPLRYRLNTKNSVAYSDEGESTELELRVILWWKKSILDKHLESVWKSKDAGREKGEAIMSEP